MIVNNQQGLEDMQRDLDGERDVDTCDICHHRGAGTLYSNYAFKYLYGDGPETGDLFLCDNCQKDGF